MLPPATTSFEVAGRRVAWTVRNLYQQAVLMRFNNKILHRMPLSNTIPVQEHEPG